MTPFLHAWRTYMVGSVPPGDAKLWAWLYRVSARIERCANWCKVATWKRSIR